MEEVNVKMNSLTRRTRTADNKPPVRTPNNYYAMSIVSFYKKHLSTASSATMCMCTL